MFRLDSRDSVNATMNKPSYLSKLGAALLLWCCLIGSTAVAQETSVLAPSSQGSVSYVSGGIGIDEVEALHAIAAHYNLRMLFAGRNGEYLSDIDVRIASQTGATLLAVRTEGPLLYVQLPPGRYRIAADSHHSFEARWVNVPLHGGIDANFHWPDRQHDHAPRRHAVCDGDASSCPLITR